MTGALGIIAFIGVILLMTIVHEFGHYWTARKFGMKVEEYFIGVGPRIFSFKRGDTTYGLKAILVAAYVKIAGMNPFQTVPEEELPMTYGAKPIWQRAIVVAAGSFTHPFVAIALLWVLFAAVGISATTTTLENVEAATPAAEAGFRSGDRIVAAGGEQIKEWTQFVGVVQASSGTPLEIEVERGSANKTLTVTPVAEEFVLPDGTTQTFGRIGVEVQVVSERQPLFVGLGNATRLTGLLIVDSARVIPRIFSPSGLGRVLSGITSGGSRTTEDPVGIVGAGRFASQAARQGEVETLFLMLASIVVIIGVLNLLPLPPLDGGHLLILLIEKIRGKKVDMKKVIPVSAAVIAFFAVLVLSLLYLDIVRPVTNPFQ